MIASQDLLPHMRHVLAAERDLHDLGLMWQMIESSATISCPVEAAPILPTLVDIRQRFDSLQARLVDKLVEENQAELGDELGAVAQCAIDILVRNLYERTADVGFLATDAELAAFCAADAATREQRQAAVHARLMAYQAKYTVYDDILLVAPDGEVLARLNTALARGRSHDPMVAQAVAQRTYVERFGPSDLAPDLDRALLYAQAVRNHQGQAIGVLVLRFRFADEMQRIFDAMADERHEHALVLIDDHQRVIASNDTAHIALGAVLRPPPPGEASLSTFGGREYVAVCCPSAGYQGYAGPDWRAMAMVSLLTAYRRGEAATDDDETMAPLDNPELMRIATDAGSINRELRRTVWNGRLMASAQTGDRLRLKAVLAQVHHAGNRTRNRVSQAIRDLYRTALARARGQAHALARLAADIMDRNLYERANDCRWWAASPAIQAALEAAPGQADGKALNQVLDHINSLYTVYSRLVVFDADGQVRGASRLNAGTKLAGPSVPPGWLQAVRNITDPQHYAVSAFEVPALTPDHAPTYVYLAAVRRDHGRGQFLGGVAIIFNAEAEFGAMLRDVMGDRPGFAAFVDAAGQVLACTDDAVAAGQALAFSGDEAEVEHLGAHYACARVRAGGYREFKTSDGYDNGVQVVVGLRLGAAERRRHSLTEIELTGRRTTPAHQALEAAVFSVGPHRYALPGEALIMAVPMDGLVRTPGDPGNAGLLEVQIGEDRRALNVVCARHRFGVHYPARATDGVVLVLRSSLDPQRPALGLRVDDVLGVLEIHRDDLHPPPALATTSLPIQGLIDCQAHAAGEKPQPALVQMLDAGVFLRGR